MTAPSRRIVFLGTHGQYNIGDELLLETFLTQLGTQHRYLVNSYDPDFTRGQLRPRFDVEVTDTGADRLRLLRALRGADLLVFGGGSIIKELYASTGRNPYSTLAMILGVVTFARRIARKPVAMLNVGVGPLRTRTGLWLARRILSQVDLVTVRDQKSFDTCREIGIDATLVPDAVFSIDEEFLLRPADDVPAPRSDGPLRVALNLNFDIENPEAWQPFLDRLADALESVHSRHPLEVHALPMQIGFKEHDDVEVLDDLAGRLTTVPFVRHEPRTHVDAARLIRDSDVLVSERLHAIVMASILGVPSFVLAYDVKVRELAKTLGLAERTIDINEPFEAAVLADGLVDLIEKREEVSGHVRSRSTALRETARESFAKARSWATGR